MSDETGKRIGDYEILAELGEGGMGRVYKVRNVISDRIEAMKILLPDLVGRQELAARFLREIKLLASLNHPNIAQLRTAFTHENQLVMVMEYVEGTTLATRLLAGPISLADTLSYIGQVLDALGYAHHQNIIHRDIKPGNMMLTPQGVVKVMDFGIARSDSDRTLTLAGTSIGTINYMSPEQVKGEAADARSDIYSVGVCLYEMVTGKKPFEAGSDYSVMAAHVKETPRPPLELQPGIPDALNQIILMAIAKDPAQRFQSATAFRNALSSVQGTSQDTSATAEMAAVPASVAAGATKTSTSPIATYAVVPPAPSAQVAAIPPMPIPQPAAPSGHRGLYMALGALIVVAGLVIAGIYLPKRGKAGEATRPAQAAVPAQPAETPSAQAQTATDTTQTAAANTTASGAETQSSSPSSPSSPASTEAAAAAAAAPVVLAREATKLKSHVNQATTQASAADEAGSSAQSGQPAQPASASASAPDLQQMEDEVDQLTARAGAVNASLDHLRQQQAASGYGLRGDISGRQESMKVNLARAQDAVSRGDAAGAKRYIGKLHADLDVLEKFLGR